MLVIDTMGSPMPSGFINGVFSSFGEYDECLDIESPMDGSEAVITGKYCLLKPILPMPPMGSLKQNETIVKLNFTFDWMQNMNFDKYVNVILEASNLFNRTFYRMGICMPSTCNSQEVENAINQGMF